MRSFSSEQGTVTVLAYVGHNPGTTAQVISAYCIKIAKFSVTTASVYRKLNQLEQQGLVTRLPTDKMRLILTFRAEEMLRKKGLHFKSSKLRMNEQMSFEEIISNLGDFYQLGDGLSHGQYTVFPVLITEPTNLSVLGLVESEEKELAWIQETEGAESVDLLLAINKTQSRVLIPYLHQVEGGKQDRTIFEPILVPIGHDESNPLGIPAKCIEQSRWTYSSSRGAATSHKFKSAKTRMATQMANVSASASSQGAVWDTIGAASSILGYGAAEAPTGSYREIQEQAYTKEKDLAQLLEKLTPAIQINDQIGLIAFYGEKILGVEIYGSPNLWRQFSELVLKGFLADWVFLKETKTTGKAPTDLPRYLGKEFTDLKITQEEPTGTGQLYRFSDKKWQGICVQYEGVPVHLYAAKEHVDILKGRRRSAPEMVQRVANVAETPVMQQTIMNEMTPEEHSEE